MPRGTSPRQRAWATQKHWRLLFPTHHQISRLALRNHIRCSPSTVSWVAFLGKINISVASSTNSLYPTFVTRHDFRSGTPCQIAGPQPPARQDCSDAGNDCFGASCSSGSSNEATERFVNCAECFCPVLGPCLCPSSHSPLPQHAGGRRTTQNWTMGPYVLR